MVKIKKTRTGQMTQLLKPELHRQEVQTDLSPDSRQPLWHRRGGFGLNEVIGIAAGIIIAVVVVIPGLRQFAASVLGQLTQWWNNMASGIFSN